MALWLDGKPISHLGKGFPKGKWVFDKFLKDQGGESIRWNQQKGDRENFQTAAGGEPFEGFRWRTSTELVVNFVWAYLYITDAPAGHVSKVGFEHIVVASDYIGPISKCFLNRPEARPLRHAAGRASTWTPSEWPASHQTH